MISKSIKQYICGNSLNYHVNVFWFFFFVFDD